MAVLGDVPLSESAPIVDLWVKLARRNGARVVDSVDDAGDADRIVLIWSGPGGRGGLKVAMLAEQLGLAGRGLGRVLRSRDAERRGIADAWASSSDEEGGDID